MAAIFVQCLMVFPFYLFAEQFIFPILFHAYPFPANQSNRSLFWVLLSIPLLLCTLAIQLTTLRIHKSMLCCTPVRLLLVVRQTPLFAKQFIFLSCTVATCPSGRYTAGLSYRGGVSAAGLAGASLCYTSTTPPPHARPHLFH